MLMVVHQKTEKYRAHTEPHKTAKFFTPMVKMLQLSTKKLKCPIISITGEGFKTLLWRVDQSFVDDISSSCKYCFITGRGIAIGLKQ